MHNKNPYISVSFAFINSTRSWKEGEHSFLFVSQQALHHDGSFDMRILDRRSYTKHSSYVLIRARLGLTH